MHKEGLCLCAPIVCRGGSLTDFIDRMDFQGSSTATSNSYSPPRCSFWPHKITNILHEVYASVTLQSKMTSLHYMWLCQQCSFAIVYVLFCGHSPPQICHTFVMQTRSAFPPTYYDDNYYSCPSSKRSSQQKKTKRKETTRCR